MTLLFGRTLVLSLGLAACASTPEPAKASKQGATEPSERSQPASAPASRAADAPVYDGNATQTIKARPGERFVIALPANITTPFKWVVANPNDALAKLVSDDYKDAPPASCQGCVGYAGTTTLTFEAVARGTTALNLAYRGLGDSNAPAQREVAIQLTVE